MQSIKIKVTFLSYDGVKAKILVLQSWYELTNILISNSINLNQLLKIELILDVKADNIGELDV